MQEPASQHGHDRLEFVQALRGIAALLVVMYHLRGYIDGPAYLDAGERLFGSAACGVDLFFVISGFIMVHTTWRSVATPRAALEFWIKRLARIWPVYVLLTFAYLIAAGHLSTTRWVELARAFAFLPQHKLGPPFFGFAPLGVGWSLPYEVVFYLMFGAALFAGRWRWPAFVGLFLAFVIAIPMAISGTVQTSAYAEYAGPKLLRLAANPMMWEFALGVAIGLVYRSRLQLRDRRVMGSIVALAVAAEIWQYGSGFHSGQGPLGWGLVLAIMVLALAMWNKTNPIAMPRALVRLGDISFSLYLVHPIAIALLIRWLPDQTGVPFIIAATTLAIVLSAWSFRYLERGLAEWVRDRLLSRVRAARPSR